MFGSVTLVRDFQFLGGCKISNLSYFLVNLRLVLLASFDCIWLGRRVGPQILVESLGSKFIKIDKLGRVYFSMHCAVWDALMMAFLRVF